MAVMDKFTAGRFGIQPIIWRCNGKYVVKGEKGCESGHIDDGVLYEAFVDVFNAMVKNRESFISKWRERVESDNALIRYKAKQFITTIPNIYSCNL